MGRLCSSAILISANLSSNLLNKLAAQSSIGIDSQQIIKTFRYNTLSIYPLYLFFLNLFMKMYLRLSSLSQNYYLLEISIFVLK